MDDQGYEGFKTLLLLGLDQWQQGFVEQFREKFSGKKSVYSLLSQLQQDSTSFCNLNCENICPHHYPKLPCTITTMAFIHME